MIPHSLLPLANHLWQSTLFAAAAGLLTVAFRRNRAPVRYGLWLAASLKFLIPFSLLTAAAAHFAPSGAPTLARSAVLPAIHQISRPFDQVSAVSPVEPPRRSAPHPLVDALMAIWLCGFAANLIAWTRQWRRVRSALRRAIPLSLAAPIPVMSTLEGIEPGVFGIFRPVLLLPAGIAERLTPQQFEAILVHELCHVRRRDNLASAVHMVVEALFWFHPLVWWIESRLVAERELACDEAVLGQCCNAEAYAEGILRVCRWYTEAPACVSGVTGSDLKRRIEAIMNGVERRNLNAGRKVLLAAAAALTVAVPMIVGTLDAPRLRAQTAARKQAAFEVISIKPNTEKGPIQIGWDVKPGGRFHGRNMPLLFLIAAAYDVPFQSPRLAGLPDWAVEARYDIDAAPERGAIPPGIAGKALDARVRPMLQALLADRFKLVIRREAKEMPVYAITLGKGDLKLKLSATQEKDCGDDKAACHNLGGGMGRGMHGSAVDLDDVALFASNWTDRPIINRTGLNGLYEIDTEGWASTQPRPPRSDGNPDPEAETMADPTRPSVFMIFSRMGLRLEPQKAPLDVYVVESIDRPAGN